MEMCASPSRTGAITKLYHSAPDFSVSSRTLDGVCSNRTTWHALTLGQHLISNEYLALQCAIEGVDGILLCPENSLAKGVMCKLVDTVGMTHLRW